LATINKATRDILVTQALKEIQFARQYKQGKISNWQKNETLYYASKKVTDDSRANIELGRAQEFVHTLMSKTADTLSFNFIKRKNSQLKKVKRLNSLRVQDQNDGDWDMKDSAGKKQSFIYGRTIFSYYADSPDDEYQSHMDPIDVYDFLIDPSAGGIDIDIARYLGNYGVIKSRQELTEGSKGNNSIYIKSEVGTLLEGGGYASDVKNQEETNKKARIYDTNVTNSNKEVGDPDKFKFWQWYTTYKGERYYLLLNESGSAAIRVELLSDLFPVVKKLNNPMWPFWTYAAFIDLTEFWTPSYLDYVREIFMGQAVSINQSMDNSEQINKPTKLVDVSMVEDLSSLKYKRGGGYILVKGATDVAKAVQNLQVPAINTPLLVYDKLEAIQEKASGVNASAKGSSGEKLLGVYEGNQENTADRFALFNKSCSYGYKRFSKLYELGVRDNLTKKIAIEMLGPDGIETEMVSRRDIFGKDDEFGVLVESARSQTILSENTKKTKLQFLSLNATNPKQNQTKAYEISALIAGFDEETIRQLTDTTVFGDEDIMSEADRDIEELLEGKRIKPNQAANTAYKQKFVTYLRDHEEDMDIDQFKVFANYILLLDPIITRNMVTDANTAAAKMAAEGATTAVPTAPVVQAKPIISGQ
jgi:hypothetical protein